MADTAPSRFLESLPARPPTPPRETHHAGESFLKQPLLTAGRCNSLDPRSSLHTPPSAQSLLASTNQTGSASSSRQKKVEFSAQADYKEPPVYPDPTSNSLAKQGHTPPPVVVLPPSSSASRPAKSILKVTTYETVLPTSPVNIADMLASTVQQLVGADRESRLDAYLMLARALKMSDNLPDRIALQSKMSLFTQFIQRDITASKAPEGTLDSTLVIAALDLLNTFLRFSAIASTLPNDFGVFVIDHCIRSFETSNVPRDVLRTLMRVVALQSFSAKVMTSDRVGRLVSALHNLEQHESKNTLVMRSIIYRALVKNNKMLMAVHLEWLPDLLADMLSTVPHIREAAITLGLEAAFALGRERPVANRVMELLQAITDDERYLDNYANRLRAMTKSKAESSAVPQVWSVVTLFLRNPEKWDFFMEWLYILQGCFNSSDFRTKEEANHAWSRFTFALLRDNRALSKKMTTVLTQALTSQLRRRGSGKQADDLRRTVLGCACNLFYYTMRNTKELDNIWDNSVKPIVLQMLEQSGAAEASRERRRAYLTSSCAVLNGLLDCSTARPWNEDRITKSAVVAPEDLPAVDAKWIRRNADRVFALVGPILNQSFVDLSIPRSAAQTLWRSVVGAVSVAAAKEVKVSPETAAFVGHAFSLLFKLWTAGVPLQTVTAESNSGSATDSDKTFASSQFLAATREYILAMVDSLGSLPFTEKQLSKDAKNTFIPVATPSQRAGRGHSISRTPLRHLFSILSTLPPGVQDDDDFADFWESVFAPFFSAKSSKGRRALAYEMLQTIPMDAMFPYGPWQVVAARIASSLTLQNNAGSGVNKGSSNHNANSSNGHFHHMSLSPSSNNVDGAPAGHEYREVVRVLERGLRSTPRLPWPRWQFLFCTLCDKVREDAGEAGLAMAVLDPLAKFVLELQARPITAALSLTASRAAVELVSLGTQPRDRQAVDAARRRLWGSSTTAPGSLAPFDTFEHMYELANSMLQREYVAYDVQDADMVELSTTLLKGVARFLSRCHEQLFVQSLAAVQDGLACWIRDEKAKLRRLSPTAEVVSSVWEATCALLERVCDRSSLPLNALETLLCAAFSSKHRLIVNRSLALWERMFGSEPSEIDYPENLKSSLIALQGVVDVVIPGLGAASVESDLVQEPMFIDSQDDLGEVAHLSSANLNSYKLSTPRPPSSRRHATPTPTPTPLAVTSPSSINRASSESASKKSRDESRRDKSKSTPPRPRHDDSQIEFTAIGSTRLPSHESDATSAVMDVAGNVLFGDESQVLTERQLEVRDRQRETNALYSDAMSSSPSGNAAARRLAARSTDPNASLSKEDVHSTSEQAAREQEKQASSPAREEAILPEQVRAATPEPTVGDGNKDNGSDIPFTDDDFIASTPTPRRGQALVFPVVNDNEIDPPSSPPEPRRYPLLPEMASRSRSSSILDEWQFSSSPLSGSPIAAHHTAPEPELSLEGVVEARLRDHAEGQQGEETPLEDRETAEQSNSKHVLPTLASELPAGEADADSANSTGDSVAGDSTRSGDMVVEITPAVIRKTSRSTVPSTPRQTRRSVALSQEASQETTQESQASAASSTQDSAYMAGPVLAQQSMPRSRRTKRKSAAETAAPSSPIRRSSSTRRYKLMAMPPPSMRDISFRMSDGEERSMLRLAIELDMFNKRSQTSPVTTEPVTSQGNSNVGSAVDGIEILDCITVRTSNDTTSKEEEEEQEEDGASSQGSTQGTPPQRSNRRKRKRSSSVRVDDATVKSPAETSIQGRRRANLKRRSSVLSETLSTTDGSQASSSPVPEPAEEVADTTAEAASSPTHDTVEEVEALASDDHEEEIQSQLALELEVLSNRGGARHDVVDLTTADAPTETVEVEDEAEPASVMEVDSEAASSPPAKKPRLAGILSMLRGSLELLQAATLSRDEVNQIEDVCMDVKRALYDAERRGRE